MKPVDLGKLAADPILAARARVGVDTVTVRGFVRSVDEQTIALATSLDGDSFVEYPRASVVAAFREDDSTETTLVVQADSRVRVVALTRAPGAGGAGCGTECQSEDGKSKCCCGVGERCRSTLNTCWCEPATRFEGGGGYPPATRAYAARSAESGLPAGEFGQAAWPHPFPEGGDAATWGSSPSAMAQSVPGGPSTVPPGYRRVCRRVPYWICVEGGRCWTEYYWECTYYPIPRAAG
jgi:hypothetical protein